MIHNQIINDAMADYSFIKWLSRDLLPVMLKNRFTPKSIGVDINHTESSIEFFYLAVPRKDGRVIFSKDVYTPEIGSYISILSEMTGISTSCPIYVNKNRLCYGYYTRDLLADSERKKLLDDVPVIIYYGGDVGEVRCVKLIKEQLIGLCSKCDTYLNVSFARIKQCDTDNLWMKLPNHLINSIVSFI
jgi:hypothetical protein